MKNWVLSAFVCFLGIAGAASAATTPEILIADRLSNSVYRYSPSGAFLGVLVHDTANLNGPTGIAISPDHTKLFVASSQNNEVVEYDYNFFAGTASNPTVFADSSDGLSFPNSITFNPAGNRIYVSNLGGTGVDQFNLDGSSAGAPINGAIEGGAIFQYSGLAFAPDGRLLVGGFQDYPAGVNGAVARSDAAITSISEFIGPSASLNGVGTLLMSGNNVYVSSLFANSVSVFNAMSGAPVLSFSTGDFTFPQSMVFAPDGTLLVGLLGFAAGAGDITRYNPDGTSATLFANASSDPTTGFTEATAMVVATPEPATVVPMLLGAACATLLAYRTRQVRSLRE